MAQKLFAPFKKIPHQVQNIPFIKKAYDARFGKFKSELFGGNLSSVFGFPQDPTAFAHDPILNLIAIGTEKGEIRVLGAPGVEFTAFHEECPEVVDLLFIPEEGRIISLTNDNHIHYWELDVAASPNSQWHQLKTLKIPDSEGSKVTALHLSQDRSSLYLGNEAGAIRRVGVPGWTFEDFNYSSDAIANLIKEEHRSNLKFGSIVKISGHPLNPNQLLIGYAGGLALVLDITTPPMNGSEEGETPTVTGPTVTHLMLWEQALEAACWQAEDGREVLTSYGDGSFLVWPIGHGDGGFVRNQDPPTTPYGPFPCNAITKIMSKTSKIGNFTIFAGGMPRSSYGHRHTLSIMRDQEHVCFNFSAPLIGCVTLEDPSCILLLTQRELLCVDLIAPNWPLIPVPYLGNLDAGAPITSIGHLASPPASVIGGLESAKENNGVESYWPITGGADYRSNNTAQSNDDLLLTGHADGSVRIWSLGYGGQVRAVARLDTARLYHHEGDEEDTLSACTTSEVKSHEGDWPPFRSVGLETSNTPSPLDPRLAITSLSITTGGDLLVGGSAGQASLWQLAPSTAASSPSSVTADLFSDLPLGTAWTGERGVLSPREDLSSSSITSCQMAPVCLVQIQPPAPLTAAALHTTGTQLMIAMGTAHGFAVVGSSEGFKVVYRHNSLVHSRRTTEEQEDSSIRVSSRGQQIKKSLRTSFRRLKKFRPAPPASSGHGPTAASTASGPPAVVVNGASDEEVAPALATVEQSAEPTEPKEEAVLTSTPIAEEEKGAAEQPEKETKTTATNGEVEEPKPEVVTVSESDSGPGLIRYLHFSATSLGGASEGTLWVGTQGGCVLAHSQISAGPEHKEVSIVLSKELQLKHGAPVVGLEVLDVRQHHAPLTSSPLPVASPAPVVKATSCTAEAVNEQEQKKEGEEAATTAPETTEEAKAPKPETNTTSKSAPPHQQAPHHELIVCTEEQVKVFSLPLLRARHKYKFHLMGAPPAQPLTASSSVNGTASAGEVAAPVPATVDAPAAAPPSTSGDVAEQSEAPANTASKSPVHQQQARQETAASRGGAVSFAIQRFSYPNSTDTPNSMSPAEYAAVVALGDGAFVVLALPSLRKQVSGTLFSGRPGPQNPWTPRPLVTPVTPDCLSPLIVSLTGGSGAVSVWDLGRLSPSRYGSQASLELAEGMRKRQLTLEEEADLSALEDEKKAAEEAKKAEEVAAEEEKAEDRATMGEAVQKLHAVTSQDSIFTDKSGHIGDITMDSIKDYISTGEGTMTVKRYENTTEKRTLVQAGQVTTLLHEREEVDGKVVKDDTVKVMGGGQPAIRSA